MDARLIGVVFLVGGAWTLIRAGFVGVTISDRGVVVRNLWRTYSLPWAEVQSIDPPGAYGLAHQGIQIRSRSGRVVYVAAFGRTPTDRAGYDQAVLSALRDAWHDSLKS